MLSIKLILKFSKVIFLYFSDADLEKGQIYIILVIMQKYTVYEHSKMQLTNQNQTAMQSFSKIG